jgi:hypothetical protein
LGKFKAEASDPLGITSQPWKALILLLKSCIKIFIMTKDRKNLKIYLKMVHKMTGKK